jgi:hypothetical protein
MQTLFRDSPKYPVPKPLNYFEQVYKFQWGKEVKIYEASQSFEGAHFFPPLR